MLTRPRIGATGLAALAFVALITATGTEGAVAADSACGALAGNYDPDTPPHYDHVVVLMEENWSYQEFANSTAAPYLKGLSQQCGNEAFLHAATHPSQPNYMAATSGFATAVGVRTDNDNVFHQVQSTGREWRSYEESMPSACSGTKSGTYRAGHNPAFFYRDLRSPTNTCRPSDLPLSPALDDDLAADRLPAYSWITPNLCHDFHGARGCTQGRLVAGDAWLSTWIPRILATPSYQQGLTLVVITFDEGHGPGKGVDCTNPQYYSGHPGCQIPTVVLSAYIPPGTVDHSDQNLYSLLGTTEDILGVGHLGRAVGQPSMRPGLHF